MKKILIYNRKGGVGKTVTCVNIAGCLDVVYGKKVLIVDSDAQGNTTSKLLASAGNNITGTVCDLFNPHYRNKDTLIKKVQVPDRKNEKYIDTRISLLPGSREIDNIVSNEMFVLKDYLDIYEDEYDYCLFDCSPSLTALTINAMCAADYILIPAFAGSDSVNGYGMVIDEINRMKENGFNVNIKVLGVFVNAVDRRRVGEKYFKSLWENQFQSNTFKSQIRDSADVPNAYEFGKPVHYFKPSSPVAKEYNELVSEMITKINVYEKGR